MLPHVISATQNMCYFTEIMKKVNTSPSCRIQAVTPKNGFFAEMYITSTNAVKAWVIKL